MGSTQTLTLKPMKLVLKSACDGLGSLSPRGLEERERQQRALMQLEPLSSNLLQPAAAETYHEGYKSKPAHEVMTVAPRPETKQHFGKSIAELFALQTKPATAKHQP
jgi:hypothetical protein